MWLTCVPLTIANRTRSLIEAYITDASIWPKCALLTVWEPAVNEHGAIFSVPFTEGFFIAAIGLKPNCYRERFGYHTTAYTKFITDAENIPGATRFFRRMMKLAFRQQIAFGTSLQITECYCRTEKRISTIAELIQATTSPQPPTEDLLFVLRAYIKRVFTNMSVLYTCCRFCAVAMSETQNYPKGCPNHACGNHQGLTTRRYKIRVEIEDQTATLTVTLFNNEAEQLFSIRSSDVAQLEAQGDNY